MARVLIDLHDDQVDELALLAQATRRPRAAVIREAIGAYIAQHKPNLGDKVFGLWQNRKMDGVQYQQDMRAEW